jgi:hypothetical protein
MSNEFINKIEKKFPDFMNYNKKKQNIKDDLISPNHNLYLNTNYTNSNNNFVRKAKEKVFNLLK